jgi:hypothetical protein
VLSAALDPDDTFVVAVAVLECLRRPHHDLARDAATDLVAFAIGRAQHEEIANIVGEVASAEERDGLLRALDLLIEQVAAHTSPSRPVTIRLLGDDWITPHLAIEAPPDVPPRPKL